MAGPSIRRVVTGTGPDGKPVIASDTMVGGDSIMMMPGAAFSTIWGEEGRPTLPASGDAPAAGACTLQGRGRVSRP